MARFQVREESQSGHCCFEATVVDTDKPDMLRGEHYAPDGVPRYEPVCECFDMDEARMIADALNALCEPRYTITDKGRAMLEGKE